jgi:hypothetical protein
VGLYPGTELQIIYVKISKSPHAILDINEERRKWSFGSKTNAKNAWGLLTKSKYFQIKTNQTETTKK